MRGLGAEGARAAALPFCAAAARSAAADEALDRLLLRRLGSGGLAANIRRRSLLLLLQLPAALLQMNFHQMRSSFRCITRHLLL
jgi:hypothetical protein